VRTEAFAGGDSSAVPAGSETATGFAPDYRPPVAPGGRGPAPLLGLPSVGQRLDDFELLAVLGSGAFATVYLARQVSLDRPVALKVSANRGHEARTLASLEHDHIVRVFSEVVDPERDLRLLCMQYVSGTTLERVIRELARRDRRQWSGRAVLEAIDASSTRPAPFDPAALRDREFLGACGFAEAVCWLGARLADALAHAHGLGVLHRDVKPANILLSRYGRPFLADFNVASSTHAGDGPVKLGGTLPYMAPEHLDAFNPESPTMSPAVDERSDVYSLGVVLFELLTGRRPFDDPPPSGGPVESLREMAARRRTETPSTCSRAEVSPVLDRVIRRCLDPRPEARYQTAAELASALDGCRELIRIEEELGPSGPLTRAALRHPFLMGALLTLLPHFLGSAVNVSYNALRIVGRLTVSQQETFRQLVFGYNVVVYGTCLLVAYSLVAPVFRTWRALAGPGAVDGARVEAARQRALRLPGWAVVLSALGWLPGGLLFPLALDVLAGPLDGETWWHFLVSFTVSGLIALTYSVLAVQFVVLRVLYPRLWNDPQDLRKKTRAELRPVRWRLWASQLLAVLIPMAGAALMLGVGPEDFTPAGYQTFRLLVTALLAVSMAGLGIALFAGNSLRHDLSALTGGDKPVPPGP
jgi:serine/threonine protein kinase